MARVDDTELFFPKRSAGQVAFAETMTSALRQRTAERNHPSLASRLFGAPPIQEQRRAELDRLLRQRADARSRADDAGVTAADQAIDKLVQAARTASEQSRDGQGRFAGGGAAGGATGAADEPVGSFDGGRRESLSQRRQRRRGREESTGQLLARAVEQAHVERGEREGGGNTVVNDFT